MVYTLMCYMSLYTYIQTLQAHMAVAYCLTWVEHSWTSTVQTCWWDQLNAKMVYHKIYMTYVPNSWCHQSELARHTPSLFTVFLLPLQSTCKVVIRRAVLFIHTYMYMLRPDLQPLAGFEAGRPVSNLANLFMGKYTVWDFIRWPFTCVAISLTYNVFPVFPIWNTCFCYISEWWEGLEKRSSSCSVWREGENNQT